jgi:uncharacterized protein (TIGR02246 family)
MNARSWATNLFAAIDRKDAEAFAAAFADDGRFLFANAPAAVGRASVLAAVTGFFSSIAALEHDLTDVWEVPGAVVVVGRVTYTRLDGSRLAVPFTDVLRLRDDLVTSWEIYIDASQLYQAV